MCFLSSPVETFLTQGTNSMNTRHPIFASNDDNTNAYSRFVQHEIFGGTGSNGFVVHANWELDKSISDLTRDNNEADEFSFGGRLPRTKDEVMKLLFDKDGP